MTYIADEFDPVLAEEGEADDDDDIEPSEGTDDDEEADMGLDEDKEDDEG